MREGGGSSFIGSSIGSSGGGNTRGSGGAQIYFTPQYPMSQDTGSSSRYDQQFPPFEEDSPAGNDHMQSDSQYSPMDHTHQPSRRDHDDHPTASMPSARLESDALKAQLVQALASVTQLTQQNAMLIEQMNILQ